MITGIYFIKNKNNNKCYIGQSKNIYKRFSQHKSKLRKKEHYNQHLQRAWNKYGEKSFIFGIIKECKESELNYFEKKYIKKYNTYNYGYNMTLGGENQPMDMEEIRNKLSLSMMGDKNHFYGKKHSLLSEIIMSKDKNTSGYFRVSKNKCKKCKQGFKWRYQYYDNNNNKKTISSVNIDDLKKKVLLKKLPWIKF